MAVKKLPYSHDELFAPGPPRVFSGENLQEIAFPLGGIGSGSISLSGSGQLIDWEIFNRPNKSYRPDYTFLSVWAQREDEEPVFRVLEGPWTKELTGARGGDWSYGFGPRQRDAAGLPRMESCTFTGAFPFAEIAFVEKKLPVKVDLEAFNPMIPGNDRDSSLPVAVFFVTLKNTTRKPVEAAVALNLQNVVGHPEIGRSRNHFVSEGSLSGLRMSSERHPADSPRFGTLALATIGGEVTHQTQWMRSGWFDPLHHFCDTFGKTGRFDDDEPLEITGDGAGDVGSIGVRVSLAPNQKVRVPIIVAWHNPWFDMYWGPDVADCCCEGKCKPKWKNFYATQFENAWEVARYTAENLDRLERETRLFRDALFSSTLPAPVLDAVSSQISILKTTTCLRTTDGTFYAFEGCHCHGGCCEGTCTHVWNYAQAMPWLFPKLERSIRDADFANNLRDEDGHMQFRMPLPLGTKADHGFHAAADGQLGGILKVYREWLICGDDEWLRRAWPSVVKGLEYAWKAWDPDKDGVIDGVHHNTYDIEFHGAEPMAGSFYLAALRTAEEMAKHLGESSKVNEYRAIIDSGRARMTERCFDGEYFFQDFDVFSGPKYQYGKGCLSDMMIGEWYAAMLGLGHLFEPEQVRSSLSAIFRNNWLPDMREHINPQRIYALNDDAGLLLASWPKGGRPEFPFPYSDEVWCGIEYQVASHLIYEGLVEEGLAIVKGVRDRHDGKKRNPWNEFECGSHYARSMASYAVMLALAGFSYSAPERRIGIAPRISAENFRCFFAVDSGWGVISRDARGAGVEVLGGKLILSTLSLGPVKGARSAKVTLGKSSIQSKCAGASEGMQITLDTPAEIRAGMSLKVAW